MTAPIRHPAGPRVEDDFYSLVCADEQLLRAEFDAIIAAEWPDRPPRAPRRRASWMPPGRAIRPPARQSIAVPRPLRLARPGWARERGPPRGQA